MKEDEIKSLQEEVDALKATLAELEAMPAIEDEDDYEPDDLDLDDEAEEVEGDN